MKREGDWAQYVPTASIDGNQSNDPPLKRLPASTPRDNSAKHVPKDFGIVCTGMAKNAQFQGVNLVYVRKVHQNRVSVRMVLLGCLIAHAIVLFFIHLD